MINEKQMTYIEFCELQEKLEIYEKKNSEIPDIEKIFNSLNIDSKYKNENYPKKTYKEFLKSEELYYKGAGFETDADNEKAEEFYKKSADMGNSKSFNELGNLYEYKLNNPKKAIMFYRKAAKLGYIEGYFNLASLFDFEDDLKSEYYLKTAADLGYEAAVSSFEKHRFISGEIEFDKLKEFGDNLEKAQNNNLDSQKKIADIYYYFYKKKDELTLLQRAFYWYCRASKQNDPDSLVKCENIIKEKGDFLTDIEFKSYIDFRKEPYVAIYETHTRIEHTVEESNSVGNVRYKIKKSIATAIEYIEIVAGIGSIISLVYVVYAVISGSYGGMFSKACMIFLIAGTVFISLIESSRKSFLSFLFDFGGVYDSKKNR